MSIPSSSSYRSSSAAPVADVQTLDSRADSYLRSERELKTFCENADRKSLLTLIVSLYGPRSRDDSEAMSIFELCSSRYNDIYDVQDPNEITDLFVGTFCSIVLESGKLDPVLTKMLQDTIRSPLSFEEKNVQINQHCVLNDYCDSSVEAALSLSSDRRIGAIYGLLDPDKNNFAYRHFEKQLAIDEISVLEEVKSHSGALSDDEVSTQFRNLLASRIASTISDDFAKRLGEEINAGSHLNRIKMLLETELVNQRGASPSSALPEPPPSPASSQPVDAHPKFRVHDSHIFPSFQNISNSSASAHLTTTTAATSATTTTTSTLPLTTTTTTTGIHTTNTIATAAPVKSRRDYSGMSTESLSKNSGQQILADFGYSLSLQKSNAKKWKEAAKLVEKFYKECAPQPGSLRERLMQTRASALKESINSLSVISLVSKKGEDVGGRLAFEKNLSPNADKALNKALFGRSDGYAQRHPDLLTGRSPVSTCTNVDMIRPDGTIVTPTVVCVSSPALGKNGAELASYLTADGRLDTDLYVKARKEISEQVLANVQSFDASKASKRVILSAAGMGEFIAGLSKEDAARATKFAAREMADLITQLGKKGVSIAYTDKDDKSDFWQQVNERLRKNTPVTFIGAMPGNWVSDNDIIVNSTSGFYQPGHGGQPGKSLDGQFGDTLLFDAHVLRSIFHSVGLRPVDLAE